MMFNDAGLGGGVIDDAKQSRAAVLCSLVGTALDLARRRGRSLFPGGRTNTSPTIAKAVQMLAQDPGLTGKQLGTRLGLSASRVARLFKLEMGTSLVDYRNRLRLERFHALLDEAGTNLLDAALAAGFGSYAQFHRVFSVQLGTTPGRFLRMRSARQNSVVATDET